MMIRLLVTVAIVLGAVTYVAAQPNATDCAEVKTQLTRAQTRLNDWPQLARYRDANTKVVAPLRNEARVVFMGDSITDSWDDPKFGGFFPGKPYIDRGISGNYAADADSFSRRCDRLASQSRRDSCRHKRFGGKHGPDDA